MCATLIRSRSAAAAAASSTRVLTPSVSTGSSATCTATGLPAGDDVADGVGQVELALRVVRLQPVERRPERLGAEDVDGGVRLADRELLRASRRAASTIDSRSPPASRTIAPVAAESSGTKERTVAPAPCARCVLDERLEELVVSSGVSPERTRTSSAPASASPALRDRVARAERPLLNRDRRSPGNAVGRVRRGDDDERLRRRAGARPRRSSPPSAARGAGAGASARPTACACPGLRPSRRLRALRGSGTWSARWLGRQDSNLGSRDQNPLPYHLATPQ